MEYKQVKYIMNENVQLKAEIERLKAMLKEAQSTSVELLDKLDDQQQPEPPQEPLEIRILRALATSEGFVRYTDLTSMVEQGGLLSIISPMIESGQIEQGKGYKITAAGRDYLSSLDKPEITDAEIDAHINEQERLHLESIDYRTDDDGQPDFYDDGGYGDYYDLGFLGE